MKKLLRKFIPRKLKTKIRKILAPQTIQVYSIPEHLNLLRCTISYNKYGGYCLPTGATHRPAVKVVLSNNVFEPKTISYMIENSGEGDIIHAGTFFGDFLPALSKGISKQSIVWAFEPNIESYRCAQITLLINDIKNIRLVNAGLGDQNKTLHIQTIDDDGTPLGGASKIVTAAKDNEGTLQDVSIVTIDGAIPSDRKIAILQLDVEGFEKEVLIGALKTISRCRPILILENLEGSDLFTSDWFQATILPLGYEQSGTLHGNVIFKYKKNYQ